MNLKIIIARISSLYRRSSLFLLFFGVIFSFFPLFTALPAYSGETETGKKPDVPRLCWAHYVAWGFNHVEKYDHWASSPEIPDPLTDRPLLGKNIQWDSGISEGTRRQIDAARLWGFDGFTVDVVSVEAFSSIMERFYRAAEGTSFKIALCIDNHRDISVDVMAEHLGNFIRKYQKHPNSFLIGERMMIFAYNIGMPLADWLAVRERLAAQGLDAYYVERILPEGSMGGDRNALTEKLRGCDGIYDFGCNGFTPEQMQERLRNARNALAENRPDGILVAGIAPGYMGHNTGFYRPFLNSRSLRDSWEAAIALQAEQVCITTWNDYVEHTHFEPSAVNRTALLRINQEYKAVWKKEPVPPRPASVIFSCMEEVLYGNDLTFEVLSFPYTTPEETVFIRFLNEDGTLFHEFAPIPLCREAPTAVTLRLTDEEIKDCTLIRVQAAVKRSEEGEGKEEEEEPVYRELFPIARRYGKTESCRTVRIPYDELSYIPMTLKIVTKEVNENGTLRQIPTASVSLKTWTAAGRVELLRNGFPVAETEISHLKAPVCVLEFPLPVRNRALRDVYVARFTNSSDGIGLSNAVSRTVSGNPDVWKQPVLVTGADFDENWPLWNPRISRFSEPRVEYRDISAENLFFVHYKFSQGKGTVIFPEEGWNIPLRLTSESPDAVWKRTDAPKNTDSSDTQNASDASVVSDVSVVSETSDTPNLSAFSPRNVLSFHGKDSCALPSRLFPADAFTLEITLRPGKEAPGREQFLFRDDSCVLKLDAQLRPVLTHRQLTLAPQTALSPERWVRLTAVCDLHDIILYLDGKEIARQPAPRLRRGINSVPVLGENFVGEIADFFLQSGIRKP